MLEDRRDSELARQFVVLEQVINALRSEFEEGRSDLGPGELRCAECGRTSRPEAVGWRAYRAVLEIATYCPECAEREFGGN